jgi:hypothetical protein
VFDRVMRLLREKVGAGDFVVTVHAEEEMTDDGLMVSDVEQVVACGAIQECQRDRATGERKYRVRGNAADGRPVQAVIKLGPTGTVVFITLYVEQEI